MAVWRQINTYYSEEGYSVGFSQKRGDPQPFRVTLRDSNCKTSYAFDTMENATSFFTKLMIEGPNSAPKVDTIDSRISEARCIVSNPLTKHKTESLTLTLALALDEVLSPEVHPSTSWYAKNVADICARYNSLPKPEDAHRWTLACIGLLTTYTTSSRPLGKNTIKARLNYFRRALRRIATFPHVFGQELSSAMASCIVQAQEWALPSIRTAETTKHFSPLSAARIKSLVDNTTLEDSVWLIKSLACGLRPSEVVRLNSSHIEGGKLRLDKVVTKTTTDRQPPVSTVLRLVLHLEEMLPTPSRVAEDVARYQFRTTAATHLCYSGLDHNSVALYLAHVNAEMSLKVYARNRPPGAGDSPQVYYGISGVRVGGICVAESEPLYFQFLLSLLLTKLRTTELWGTVSSLLFEQNKTPIEVGVASF